MTSANDVVVRAAKDAAKAAHTDWAADWADGAAGVAESNGRVAKDTLRGLIYQATGVAEFAADLAEHSASRAAEYAEFAAGRAEDFADLAAEYAEYVASHGEYARREPRGG